MAQHCIHCGTQLYDEGDYCHVCGKSKAGMPGRSEAPKPIVLPPEAESTFFQDGSVYVTSTHFTVPGQTFAISDVQGVRFQKNSSGSWPTVCYLLGMGAFLTEVFRLGLILFILGAIISTIFRPKFTVVLETVSGEVRAFTSSDRSSAHPMETGRSGSRRISRLPLRRTRSISSGAPHPTRTPRSPSPRRRY